MDSELLVGPMMSGTESKESRILHAAECCFNVRLAPIGHHDLFIGPFFSIRKQDCFSQKRTIQSFPFSITENPSQSGNLVFAHGDLGRKQLLHVAAPNNVLGPGAASPA